MHDVVRFDFRPALAKDYVASAGAPGTDCGSSVVRLSLVLVRLRLFRTIPKFRLLPPTSTSGGKFLMLTYWWDMIRQWCGVQH